MSTNRVIAIIPARGGSKGIPGKNVRTIAGKPLVAHSIAHARTVSGIEAVYVSTDDPRIALVAREHGAQIIDRPADLSGDTASSESALVHALDWLAARGEREPDAVVFLQATSPRRQPDDLSRALATFWEQGADSLFSATSAHGFMWRVGASGPSPLNYDPVHRPRRQDAPVDVIENGSIYIFKPSVLRRYQSRLGGKIAVHMMRAEDSFQIDEPWEMHLLDQLIRSDAPAASAAAPSRSGNFEGASTNSGPLSPAELAYFTRREPRAQPNYEAAYWGTVVDPDGKQRDRTIEREQHLADLAAELRFIGSLPKGRILDVGCGLGFLLSGVADGWEKHGVEVSGFAAERAAQYGQIHHGDLASAKYPDAHFDVVVLHHVIEHVDEPLALLRETLRILKPQGRLVLGTPDFDGAMARRFGEKYRLLQDPTHVSLFTNESMHRALRDSGFVVDHVDYPFFETRHFTPENLNRLHDTSQMSPAFYGSFMTFYCTKPRHAATRSSFVQLRRATEVLLETLDEQIAQAGKALGEAIARGNKILAAGNGGSAADAQHFVAELVGRFKMERRSLPGISLSSDPSIVTCLGNDYGYDQVFARQVQGFGQRGDVLIAITTSGKSPNILNAIKAARQMGMMVVSLSSERGAALRALSDHCIVVPSSDTPTIQELHMAVLHVFCTSIDEHLIG
jgi:CMP-N,N'-diacetyllegionaminic acid synthase